MCGVTAVYGQVDEKILSVFETMFTLSIVRGRDSCGVAAVDYNTQKAKTLKGTIYPINLLRTKEYNNNVLKNKNICLIGHNRAATRGQISVENAHPFQHGHITLVHNGTLDKFLQNEAKSSGTDSESICISIKERGIEETWKNLEGDATILFFDSKKKTFNILSNGRRPLYFAYTYDRRAVFVASEEWIIKGAANTCQISLEKNEVWEPEDNDLWFFEFDSKKGTIIEHFLSLETKKKHFQTHENKDHSNSPWRGYWHGYKERILNETSNKNETILNNRKFNRPKHTVSKEEFNSLFDVCTGCAEKVEYESSVSIGEDIVYCDGCISVAEANLMDVSMLRGS